jgi:hypothetical protein
MSSGGDGEGTDGGSYCGGHIGDYRHDGVQVEKHEDLHTRCPFSIEKVTRALDARSQASWTGIYYTGAVSIADGTCPV